MINQQHLLQRDEAECEKSQSLQSPYPECSETNDAQNRISLYNDATELDCGGGLNFHSAQDCHTDHGGIKQKLRKH